MIKNLLKKLTASTDDPDRMRRKQYLMMGGILATGLMILYLVTPRHSQLLHESPKEDKKQSARLDTPFEAVNPRDVWVNRVQKEAEEARAEARAVREESRMMGKKLEVLEKVIFQKGNPADPQTMEGQPLSDRHSSRAACA